jgi:hypothetical protein
MKGQTFAVEAKGVGRKDYSTAIATAVETYITPTLRQDRWFVTGTWEVDLTPVPLAWIILIGMEQEDGSWDWPASSIVSHFFELHVSIKTSHLVTIGLVRYASLDDCIANIIAERSPQIFGYNKADLIFSRGIPTIKGSVYGILAAGWPDTPTYDLTVNAAGLVSELTPAWMV